MRVGAIEPVGMTKASASNVRNRNASTKAMTIDSTVSRKACDLGAGFSTAGVGSLGISRVRAGFLDLDMAVYCQRGRGPKAGGRPTGRTRLFACEGKI